MKQDLPRPQVHAFLVCSDILHDDRTRRYVLVNPLHYVPAAHFPVKVRVCVYLQLRGGHGRYALDLSLRDGEGDSVWRIPPCEIDHPEPIFPHTVDLHDLPLDVPQPGRYDLVVSANGQEIGAQPLWVGPPEFFTAH
jgi:hypothetical protein